MKRIYRTLAVLVAALGLLAIPIGGASAARPVRINEHIIVMSCFEPLVTGPYGTLGTDAVISDVYGPSATVFYWAEGADPETDEPTLVSTVDVPVVTGDASHIDATIPVEDSNRQPAGDAILDVDLAPVGDLETNETVRWGNRLIKDDGWLQRLVVTSGTLTLPDGAVFDLTGCAGGERVVDVFITNPDSFVQSFSGILVLCDISTENYAFELGASAEEAETGARAFFSSDGLFLEGHHSDLTLTEDAFTGTIEMNDGDTGEPVGDAVVNVSFAQGDRTVIRRSEGLRRSTMTGRLLEPSGTITIPTDPATVIDLSSCFAIDGREQIIEPHPGRPEPEE